MFEQSRIHPIGLLQFPPIADTFGDFRRDVCSIVWRATDLQLDRVVSIKRAHGDGPETGGLPGEARIAAGFQHPKIVTVHALTTCCGS